MDDGKICCSKCEWGVVPKRHTHDRSLERNAWKEGGIWILFFMTLLKKHKNADRFHGNLTRGTQFILDSYLRENITLKYLGYICMKNSNPSWISYVDVLPPSRAPPPESFPRPEFPQPLFVFFICRIVFSSQRKAILFMHFACSEVLVAKALKLCIFRWRTFEGAWETGKGGGMEGTRTARSLGPLKIWFKFTTIKTSRERFKSNFTKFCEKHLRWKSQIFLVYFWYIWS